MRYSCDLVCFHDQRFFAELDLLDLDEDRELPSMPQEQDGFPEFVAVLF